MEPAQTINDLRLQRKKTGVSAYEKWTLLFSFVIFSIITWLRCFFPNSDLVIAYYEHFRQTTHQSN